MQNSVKDTVKFIDEAQYQVVHFSMRNERAELTRSYNQPVNGIKITAFSEVDLPDGGGKTTMPWSMNIDHLSARYLKKGAEEGFQDLNVADRAFYSKVAALITLNNDWERVLGVSPPETADKSIFGTNTAADYLAQTPKSQPVETGSKPERFKPA
jgi:hypothetical protein